MNEKLVMRLKIIVNLIIISLLFLLPYYLFDGKLFLGGDDTRLHYIYPFQFLKNLSFYSWVNISSLPSFLPNHHSIPILTIFSILDLILKSKVHLFYLAFSIPLVLGFIYFQKFISQFTENNFEIPIIAASIYIFSPMTVVSQMSNFLFSMYLLALIPIIAYYYIIYLKNGRKTDILKVVIWAIVLSFAFYAIQWIMGLLLCLVLGFVLVVIWDSSVRKYLKKTIIFCYFIIASQLFWLFPFLLSFLYSSKNDLGGKVASQGFSNSFALTVKETANGNIIYPFLTFYQRQIAFSHDWHLKYIFSSYYDKILILSLIFVVVLFVGLIKYNDTFNFQKKKIFLFFLVSFIAALYFSTVNIGFLRYVFLFMGNIPGFAIFRNFTDKFALAFIFLYASILALCYLVIKKEYKFFYKIVLIVSSFVIFFNFIPAKQIINAPLWKTQNIYTTVNLPDEYMEFLNNVKLKLPMESNVISFPQNIAAYSVITEDNGRHAYIGTSPFKFFTQVNDLSGAYSYPDDISLEIRKSIVEKNPNALLSILTKLNVGYLMTTNNIPGEVLNSYLFDKQYLKFQNNELIKSITTKEVIKSSKGNYIIYKLNNSPKLINSDTKITYKKINPVHYEINIKNLKNNTQLSFLETFHRGWKIYPDNKYEYLIPLKKSIFESSHRELGNYGNQWTISPSEIKSKLSKTYFTENKDGSIDVSFSLYFFPQTFLYFGFGMTVISLILGGYYLLRHKNEDD